MVTRFDLRGTVLAAAVGAITLVAVSQAAQGAVVATYLAPPTIANSGPAVVTAANVDPLITAGSITTGNAIVSLMGSYTNSFASTAGPSGSDPGITTFPFRPNSFAANGRGADTPAGSGGVFDNASSLAQNAYFSFSLQPTAGNQLQLTSITFDVGAGSSSSNRGYDLRSSMDNYAASLATEAFAQNQTTYVENAAMEYVVVNLSSFAAVTDAAPITFRMYAWNGDPGNAGRGLAAKNVDFDNIVVTGVASAVPEPASVALLGLGTLALLHRRRY